MHLKSKKIVIKYVTSKKNQRSEKIYRSDQNSMHVEFRKIASFWQIWTYCQWYGVTLLRMNGKSLDDRLRHWKCSQFNCIKYRDWSQLKINFQSDLCRRELSSNKNSTCLFRSIQASAEDNTSCTQIKSSRRTTLTFKVLFHKVKI